MPCHLFAAVCLFARTGEVRTSDPWHPRRELGHQTRAGTLTLHFNNLFMSTRTDKDTKIGGADEYIHKVVERWQRSSLYETCGILHGYKEQCLCHI